MRSDHEKIKIKRLTDFGRCYILNKQNVCSFARALSVKERIVQGMT